LISRCLALVVLCLSLSSGAIPVACIYTEAPRYDSRASLHGGERFPAGAALQVLSNGRKRPLLPGFAATADAAVSFDGSNVLFSGKQRPADPWQIWEIPAAGGVPRRITAFKEDAITPFYLPGERIVYARRMPDGFQIETAMLDGTAPVRLTYAPGGHLICDVLRDGRVLFAAPHPGAGSAVRDLYTVYTDGSGVETHRCDHGPDRYNGRELSSGDIIFESGSHLSRFTSARATQLELPETAGQFAGPVAEVSPGVWLLAYRPHSGMSFGLYQWKWEHGLPENVLTVKGMNALQPVLVRPHAVPKRHPSGLGDRPGANLLCLNAYTSRSEKIPAGSVTVVRVSALDASGSPVVLGQAPVERDGSFYIQVPGETPIRFELLDSIGKSIAAEKGWFWARRGEQRVCVGCHAGPEHAPENAAPEVLLRTQEPVKMAIPVHTRSEGQK
jgi:Hydrazine synthase alpha subunit middle domain